MVSLGLEPRAAGWKALTNPLSYGGTQIRALLQLTPKILTGPILKRTFVWKLCLRLRHQMNL